MSDIPQQPTPPKSGAMLLAFCHGPASNTELIPKEYSWEQLAQRLAKPHVGEKNGAYLIRGGLLKNKKRENDNLIEAELLIVDGDSSFDPATGEVFTAIDPDDGERKGNCTPIEVARDALDRLGYRYIIHTTHTNTPGVLNKWRAFIPAHMISPTELEAAVDQIIEELHAAGCYVETNKESKTWAQAWYLPRVKPQHEGSYKCFASLVGREFDVPAAVAKYQKREAAAAAAKPKEAPKPATVQNGPSPIEMFNSAATLATVRHMLEESGYKFAYKRGDTMRFIAPGSETGTPGVNVFKGGQRGDICAYSHHGAHDPLSGRLNDAFGILARLRHGGDQDSALAEAKAVIGWKQAQEPGLDWDDQEISAEDMRQTEKPKPAEQVKSPTFASRIVNAASLHGKPVPKRKSHVPGLIPANTVTSITGDGGIGKSLLVLQLAVSTALGQPWIGKECAAGKVLYVGAEDDIDEMHIRLSEIAASSFVELSELGNLEIVSLAGEDAVLAELARTGKIAATQLFTELREHVERTRPKLVIFDTLADLFAGDENVRTQAQQFVSLLRGIAIEFEATVILLAHPSLSGMASGSGSSGSTAWNNSVRSRLYFTRPSDDPIDDDLRVLTTKKNNYGKIGEELLVRWVAGMFQPVSETESRASERSHAAEVRAKFLELLDRHTRSGRSVSDKNCPTFAPAVFAELPENGGFSKRDFTRAMNELLEVGEVAIVVEGPPSKRRSKLVRGQNGSALGGRGLD